MLGLLFLLICTFGSADADSGFVTSWASIKERYPQIPDDTLSELLYYALDDAHPIKKKLDSFFSEVRITEDKKSLQEAGFYWLEPAPFSQTIVTKHPLFPGYVFKLFTDEQDKSEYLFCLKKRILGAEFVRKYIAETKTEQLFTVPQKWIYFIPPLASKYPQKHCLLIAEEISLLSYEENVKKWKSDAVSQSTLKVLFEMIHAGGLSDSIYPSNIPFTPDGKIAFIDTECSYWLPEPSLFPILGIYLSEQNRQYWVSLTGNQ